EVPSFLGVVVRENSGFGGRGRGRGGYSRGGGGGGGFRDQRPQYGRSDRDYRQSHGNNPGNRNTGGGSRNAPGSSNNFNTMPPMPSMDSDSKNSWF
ncbi:hypothetical protein LPJ57_006263, partial [Coemansia sp. RSA 486]